MKTTKPITICAGEKKEIHGITKIKHGGYSANCTCEHIIDNTLPKGLKAMPGYCQLSPGSSRVSSVIYNSTDKDSEQHRSVSEELNLELEGEINFNKVEVED